MLHVADLLFAYLHWSSGIKARAEQVEEHHCLMGANMLIEAHKNQPGFSFTKQSLADAITKLNQEVAENPRAQITAWKMRALMNIVLFLPQDSYKIIQQHYMDYTWERSFLTEELMQEGLWRADYKFTKCKGEWLNVFTMTESCIQRFAKLLDSQWKSAWPLSRVHTADMRALRKARPHHKSEDEHFAGIPISHMYAWFTCFFENWLIPQVTKEFGSDGRDYIEKQWGSWEGDLVAAMKLGIESREDPNSYKLVSLSLMDPLYTTMCKQFKPASGGSNVPANAKAMSVMWAEFLESVEKDKEFFQSCIAAKHKLDNLEWVDKLRQTNAMKSTGIQGTDVYLKSHLFVTRNVDLTKSATVVFDFIDGIGVSPAGDVPICIMWDLNTIGNSKAEESVGWKSVADSFASLITARSRNAVGIMIQKKSVSHSTKRSFHNLVVVHLEAKGLDCDTDLSLNYKAGHGNNRQSRTQHGYIVYGVGKKSSTNPWVSAEINHGSLLDLPLTMTSQQVMPVEQDLLPYEGGAQGGSMSIGNRNKFTPPEVFSKIVELALAGMGGGVLNKTGRPLVVFACLGVLHPAIALALAAVAIESKTMDLRMLFIPSSEIAGKTTHGALEDLVYLKWFNGELEVEGFRRRPLVPFVPAAKDEVPDKLVFTVASLNEKGAFMVPEASYKAFLNDDSTYTEVHAARLKWKAEAESDTAPRWLVGAPSATPTAPPVEDVLQSPDKSPSGAFTSQADLLAQSSTFLADCPSENGKFRLIITKEGHGYAIVASGHTTSLGEKICLLGSGRRLDEAELEKARSQGFVILPMCIKSDNTQVFFKKDHGVLDHNTCKTSQESTTA